MRHSVCDICGLPVKGMLELDKPAQDLPSDMFRSIFGHVEGDEWKNGIEESYNTEKFVAQLHCNLDLCNNCRRSMEAVFGRWYGLRKEEVKALIDKFKV